MPTSLCSGNRMSKCELIELKDLSLNDRIELAAPSTRPPAAPLTPRQVRAPERPRPSQAVRLVGDSVRVEGATWSIGESGKGHDFQPCSHTQLTWCDLCGDFIWGLYKQSLRCDNCRYTCHYRCLPLIQLDCSTESWILTDQTDVSEDTIETDTNVDEQIDWGKQELTVSAIQQKVKEYNAQINSNLNMVLDRDGTYTGFIKVQFKLARPVSIPPPQKPSVTHEGGPQEDDTKRRTSFYLPRDTAKHLHISSHTRAREVIEALLKKFTVVDNPAKFALFERSERQNQVYLRKLPDEECPLHLRLCAGPSEKVLSLVLKENETGEVNWDAFSLPELCNFLRILQREEEEHVRQIIKRYAVARDKMKTAMASLTTPG
ncbi:ras association domain-containing protein 1-like isoform X1 [Hypomesus transpacificus]|uniref:ras association domain-containing protein 1-like isoform X1 n=1 Tax=Hypomesus transpacificus TaxID=137520 RepID=UPI001F08602B|nr:ras association domain-containing protein 1-like isoform X1 [Hypomesus transpacificus]XP_046881891.1 ras association domain-containing protein 1-like isoform X1 [Hypomesus transpacificus]XP_046881892.1 ras association domain-containing protein 1-like isoform X1 [Hypomesus transpacificus]XP_046881893.1 ras association domain-containing protein 1-like isoform X1 [Hypomesus transpacificus]